VKKSRGGIMLDGFGRFMVNCGVSRREISEKRFTETGRRVEGAYGDGDDDGEVNPRMRGFTRPRGLVGEVASEFGQ